MILFWAPIVLCGLWAIHELINGWECGDHKGDIADHLFIMGIAATFGLALYVIIGGILGFILPVEKITLEEYPIYSIQDSSFVIGCDDNSYYYKIDSDSGKQLSSMYSNSVMIKNTVNDPKFEKIGHKFSNPWSGLIANLWLNDGEHATIYIPQNATIQ